MTPGNILGMAALIGLDLVALTDHNSCKNCPSFLAQAKDFPLKAIAGMELTTSEEVHVLCYFEELEAAMAFDAYVETQLLPISNTPDIFGNQLLCDAQDQYCGTWDPLLISATAISFFRLPELLSTYHGHMVPAHIDKPSNSLLSQLGFITDPVSFHTFEVHDLNQTAHLKEKYPSLNACQVLCSSDAHQLCDLHEKEYLLSMS